MPNYDEKIIKSVKVHVEKELHRESIEAYVTGSLFQRHEKIYSIIRKNGKLHFRTPDKLERSYYCGKIIFSEEEVADLYAEYIEMKYDRYNRSYFCNDCLNYHLTSSLY